MGDLRFVFVVYAFIGGPIAYDNSLPLKLPRRYWLLMRWDDERRVMAGKCGWMLKSSEICTTEKDCVVVR